MQNGMEQQGPTAHGQRVVDRIVEIDVLAVELQGAILEIIRIEEHVSVLQRKPKAKTYAFLVGKTRLEVTDPLITGRRILELAGIIRRKSIRYVRWSMPACSRSLSLMTWLICASRALNDFGQCRAQQVTAEPWACLIPRSPGGSSSCRRRTRFPE